MDAAEVRRRYGQVFDSMAEEYDRERRSYPPELVDGALRVSRLSTGDRVLEVGCGTGLLTEQLVARGLRVLAIDPGTQMIAQARRRLGPDAPVDFEPGRFEDADVSAGCAAVFCATAWHWLDPAVSWRRAWEALEPGGRLCLLGEVGVADPRATRDTELLQHALEQAAPELAAELPAPRAAETVLDGARERRDDISAVWSWLGEYDLGDPAAAGLFDNVQITAVPLLIEQTADRLNAYLSTTSFHARLAPAQREVLAAENRQAAAKLGGALRYGTLAVLVSGRRT